jgi:hypothetical protein
MKQVKKNLGKLPPVWVADAGYGSEENYLAMQAEQITSYVKYNTFYKESKKRYKISEKEKYQFSKFQYDEQKDTFTCPMGKELIFEKIKPEKTATGFITEKRTYRCLDCDPCPSQQSCTQSKYGRSIQFSPTLARIRKEAYQRLISDQGRKLRALRYIEVEAVFGMIKGNKSFRRFHLRGKDKVEVEWGLLSLAHNMTKIATI